MMKRLQSLLQWFFMRVEALFNSAFGDRLNPLYYLGPIAYFLMWLEIGRASCRERVLFEV